MEMNINLNKLISERNKRAWTQGHLAEVCGLSLRTIQRIEKTGAASHESIQALASVFELSVEDLIYRETISEQNTKTAVEQPLYDKLFSKFGLVLMMIVPAIVFSHLVTGTYMKIDTSAAGDMSSFVMSSSVLLSLFSHTPITYYTFLPAIFCFCISLGIYKNQQPWIKRSLIFSTFMFLFSSPILGTIIALLVISLLVYLKKQPLIHN